MSRVGQHLHRYPHAGQTWSPGGRRCAAWRFVAIYSTRLLLLPREEPLVRLIYPGNQGPRKREFGAKFHARLGVTVCQPLCGLKPLLILTNLSNDTPAAHAALRAHLASAKPPHMAETKIMKNRLSTTRVPAHSAPEIRWPTGQRQHRTAPERGPDAILQRRFVQGIQVYR